MFKSGIHRVMNKQSSLTPCCLLQGRSKHTLDKQTHKCITWPVLTNSICHSVKLMNKYGFAQDEM